MCGAFPLGWGVAGGSRAGGTGKGNRPELGDLDLNIHRAHTLVAGDQLQHLVICWVQVIVSRSFQA